MVKVYVKKQSNYPVSSMRIKKELSAFFKEEGITSEADVNVGVVGEKKMLELARNYLKEKNTLHNVLSFPASEIKGEFVYPPDNILHLGEIVVCFPKAFEEARDENILIETKIIDLVKHGALHLLGKHH